MLAIGTECVSFATFEQNGMQFLAVTFRDTAEMLSLRFFSLSSTNICMVAVPESGWRTVYNIHSQFTYDLRDCRRLDSLPGLAQTIFPKFIKHEREKLSTVGSQQSALNFAYLFI